MCKLELKQIYLQLEHEIKHYSHPTNSDFRKSIKKDAQNIILEIKSDIDNWINLLNEREIACHELEDLLKSKCNTLWLSERVSKSYLSEEREMSLIILPEIISKSVINTYLKNLFPHKSISHKRKTPEFGWF